MMQQITLRNDFHNTFYTLHVPELPHVLSRHQIRRARDALCPSHREGCICGTGALNVRGEQPVDIEEAQCEYGDVIQIDYNPPQYRVNLPLHMLAH